MKYFFLVLFFFTSLSFSQNNKEIDSLKKIISEKILPDSVITKSYYRLSWIYKKAGKDSCLIFADNLKDYSKEKKSDLGYYYYYKFKAGNFPLYIKEAEDSKKFIISNLEYSLEYAKKQSNPKFICFAYDRLTYEYRRFGDYKIANTYAEKSIELSSKHNLWKETAYTYTSKSESFLYDTNETAKALQIALKSDSIYNAHNFQGIDKGINLSIIGSIYKELDQYEEALKYHHQALTIFDDKEDDYQKYYVVGKIASLEKSKKNYKKAIKLFLECIDYYKKNSYPLKEAGFSQGLSEVYLENSQFQKALEYANISFKIRKEHNNKFGVLLSLLNLSKIKFKTKEHQESFNLALEANVLANEMTSIIDIEESLSLLEKNAVKLDRHKEAYFYAIQHQKIKDSLLVNKEFQKLQELETKFQTQQKEQEISLLKSENELVLQQKKNQRNLLLGAVLLTALTGLFFYFQFRNRKKTNNKLRELDTIKSTFFANISHEFRTPLTLISGPIQQLLKKDDLEDDEKDNLQSMQVNSQRLISLVDQLLDLSKIEAGSLKLKISNHQLIPLVGTLVDSFQYILNEKNITLIRHINPNDQEVWFDKTIVEKIVLNLLTNAQKYTPKDGSIVCSANVNKDRFVLEIKNSGKGINEGDLNKIFDRFYQVNDNQQGVGIGLALIKELVTLHKGTIHVTSVPNEWTTFTVELPLEKALFKNNIIEHTNDLDVLKDEENIQIFIDSEVTSIEDEETNAELPILLLVEDNKEVRDYLQTIFKKSYNILIAKNGEEGINTAIDNIPDLIISDIMMPVKNGIELCNTLKTDERTSHIPIILLTAKVGEENELEGIKTGADDYITKPFNQELLALKVEKYIEVRKKMQDRYSQELILKPTDITLNSADEIFLGKVQEVIDYKIIESSFSIDEFCTAVGMSRMQLHRKLKALTGQTTSEFIRTQRLKLAADLLKKSDVNISQIGYSVGFNNPAYFSKCFKELYHCSPTEYSKKES